MYVIEPLNPLDSEITSTVAPNDHDYWNGDATYAAGDRVSVPEARSNYEALRSNSGTDPTTDDGSTWLRVGAMNRWRPFDGRLSEPTLPDAADEDIRYTITLPSLVTGLALFGLGGSRVIVAIDNASGEEVWRESLSLVDTTSITTWEEYFFGTPRVQTEALMVKLPGLTGSSLTVRVRGPNARLGEIVYGVVEQLGECIPGTEIGFDDFSTKGRDTFGNPTLIERDFADIMTFQFMLPIMDARRVKRVVSRLRARPAVWFAAPEIEYMGTAIYGFLAGGLRIPLQARGVHFATLEIEGLV